MTVLVTIVLATVGFTIVYALIKAKRSWSKNYDRQKQLLLIFNAFLASNLTVELHEKDIKIFMDKTSDARDCFLSSDIADLRNLLHDNAHRLIDLRNRSNHVNTLPETQDEIADLKKEILRWFKETSGNTESIFKPEMKLNPSVTDILKWFLDTVNKAIRA